MKTINLLILSTVFCYSINSSFAQEACKVLKPEIAEKYDGKCKNGLANGKGMAEGQDKYVGRFKDGLPHGQGKYTWSTGEVYEGSWKEGKKEGSGKLLYKKNGVDSIKNGIWKNDVFYKAVMLNPYTVVKKESVSRYSVRRIGDGDKIAFTIFKNNSPTGNYSQFNISALSGTSFNVGQKQGLENVIFPARCRVTFTIPNSYGGAFINVDFEVEIKEPGNWDIDINV